MLLTQSSAGDFRDCRKLAELRYERRLRPNEEPFELSFGSNMHTGLEFLWSGKPLEEAVTAATKKADTDQSVVLEALLTGYRNRWDPKDWKVVAVEKEFRLPLFDPATGQRHPYFDRGGKLDVVLRRKSTGRLWLMEHKSAARVDASYLSKLWLDFQITYYVLCGEEIFGEEFEGVLYDVVIKPSRKEMQRFIGESDAEWEARYEKAKNKKLLKRKMSETVEEFRTRMADFYADPESFHREEILLAREDIDLVAQEAWDLAEDWTRAKREGRWYRNTSRCFKWNKACAFLKVCQTREAPAVIEAGFHRGDCANPELSLTTFAPVLGYCRICNKALTLLDNHDFLCPACAAEVREGPGQGAGVDQLTTPLQPATMHSTVATAAADKDDWSFS